MEDQSVPSGENAPNGEVDVPFGDAPKISESLGKLQRELENLKSATEHIEASQEAAQSAAEAAEDVQSATADLISSTDQVISRLDAVDFPGRLENIEEAIDRTNERADTLEGTLQQLQNAFEKRQDQIENRFTERLDAIERLAKGGIAAVVLVGAILILALFLV